MADFGFDPRIILAGMQPQKDALETMRSLQDLAQQRELHQTTLGSLLQKQRQEGTLADIYRANAQTPSRLPAALLGGGFGGEAAQWGTAQAAAEKSQRQTMQEQLELAGRALAGVKDQAGLTAAKQSMKERGISPQYVDQLPDDYEQAKPMIGDFVNWAIPVEKRASMEAAATEAEKKRAFEADEHARDRANRTKNAGIIAGNKEAAGTRDDVTALRKEISARPEIAKYRKASAELDSLKELAKGDSGASDMAIVFAFMKAMDPESVVRESEYSAAAATGRPDERMLGLVKRYWTGGKLTDSQRQSFIKAAAGAQSGHKSAFNKAVKTYRHIAAKHDYDLAELGIEADAASGPHGQTVIQGGVTYEWNPKTGEYE